MNNLELVTTEIFEGVEANIYEECETDEMYMTARQLGECLGYANPRESINKLIQRNEYLKDIEFSAEVRLTTPRGGTQITRVFNEDGIYEITFIAETDKAKQFRHWVRQLLKNLRKGKMQLAMNNVVYSPEMFDSMIQKYLPAPDTKKLNIWKAHYINPIIENISSTFNIEYRDAYDMIYDGMSVDFGFDRSCAISEYCSKYRVEECYVTDAIADSAIYRQQFVQTANKLLSIGSNEKVESIQYNNKTNEVVYADKVQKAIQPLIDKSGDNSPHGVITFRRVYSKMKSDRAWKSLMTRRHMKTKKDLILSDNKLFKEFCNTVNLMM